ncbi:hypothetical protein FLM48_09595 [Shewanella sp. Scap07]|uniref:DUF6508 domain-containing protein n=1 Tax=Shewanella sp. Scap07 TaxID=2589987 RepID=UPI0015BDA1D7|nr:DUF6508 domain-containing protein [Shewanella sp. Scap07]QLE85316.1 hypothetical protein FLM48_09595 [Shewanella sp. Scap07]
MNTLAISPLYSRYADLFLQGDKPVCVSQFQQFVAELEQQGVLLPHLNWDEWYEHSHFVDRPDYIADATWYQCQLLLTAMARLEKFSPGVIDNYRRQGVLIAIVSRMQTLAMGVAV